MAKIRLAVPDAVTVTEGGIPVVYKPKDGVIEVSEDHVASVLGAIPHSELIPEAPVNKKPEPPAKEN